MILWCHQHTRRKQSREGRRVIFETPKTHYPLHTRARGLGRAGLALGTTRRPRRACEARYARRARSLTLRAERPGRTLTTGRAGRACGKRAGATR